MTFPILVDGDIFTFRAAWVCGFGPQEGEKKIDELMESAVNAADFLSDGAEVETKVFLTGKTNFRNDVAKTHVYKGNRKKTEKPTYFQHMRTYISVNYDTTISEGEEADDLIAMAAHKANYNACVVSTDKDFRQLPCWHQNPTTNVLSLQSEDDAITYFYTQMLTGDTVDNIKGVMGIGPVKAAKLLEGHEGDAKAMYQVVLDAYDGDEERVLENGRLLHLRRTEGVMWGPPL